MTENMNYETASALFGGDARYEELSLVQRRKMDPVIDALQYTEEAEKDTFDPVHAAALRYGELSEPAHSLYPEIDEDPEEFAEYLLREYRSTDAELKRWERQFNLLQQKVGEHAELLDRFLTDHGLDGEYGEDSASYVEQIEEACTALGMCVDIDEQYVRKRVEGKNRPEAKQVIASDLADKMTQHNKTLEQPPAVSDGLQEAMQEAFTVDFYQVLDMDVTVDENTNGRSPQHPSETTQDAAQNAGYAVTAVENPDNGTDIDWSRYGVDDQDGNGKRYWKALAAFQADSRTPELDADLLRDVIDWTVHGRDTLPETVWENGTVNEHIRTAGSCLKSDPELYEGSGVGTRSSRDTHVATAKDIADRHIE